TIAQQNASALSKLQINMNDLSAGMYILNWRTENQAGSFKMVKR
ncbi:MAG TPA: T9SS type A sorting domain-containing protein, partial [Saprospiraceae bacterium]|nr:T9SS type A sorting domain-containing protein [Saprospiraceae bacterium]